MCPVYNVRKGARFSKISFDKNVLTTSENVIIYFNNGLVNEK